MTTRRPRPVPPRRAKATPAAAAPGDVDPAFAPVLEALEGQAGVTRGRMFGSLGLRVEGRVFAMLVKGSLIVKLPRDRVDALVSSGAGEPFDPGHGRLMREWVAVGSRRRAGWVDLAREAASFVRGIAR